MQFVFFFQNSFSKTRQKYSVCYKTTELHWKSNVKSKNWTLLSCSAESGLHFKTNPKFLALEIREKFGTHGNPFPDTRFSR
jgi:hypothetical protein